MTDFGQPMPFVSGKSLVVLEFRRTTLSINRHDEKSVLLRRQQATQTTMPTRAAAQCPSSSAGVASAGTDSRRPSEGFFRSSRRMRNASTSMQILGIVAKNGMEVVGDVMEGRSVKETVKKRGLSEIKRIEPFAQAT